MEAAASAAFALGGKGADCVASSSLERTSRRKKEILLIGDEGTQGKPCRYVLWNNRSQTSAQCRCWFPLL